MSDHPEKYLVTRELAERLRVKTQTLRKWRTTGRGPSFYKLGGNVRYRVADVEEWESASRRDLGGQKTSP